MIRAAYEAWERFHAMLASVAARLFPTLTQPLREREEMRRLLDDDRAWTALFEEPLSELLERTFSSDLVRGIVLTDATIGTFAPANDRLLRQNRCFLYHVIGNGTGRWDVPVGGMGAVSEALAAAARSAGAEIRTAAEVTAAATDGVTAEVELVDGQRLQARHLLAGIAPAALRTLLGQWTEVPEGSQLKINMLLNRLPRLRDPEVQAGDAFTGTFHVNEGYEQLGHAFREASGGQIPELVPCEAYCHSLTDPSILSEELRASGAQSLTHVRPAHARAAVRRSRPGRGEGAGHPATLRSANSVLAEPLEAVPAAHRGRRAVPRSADAARARGGAGDAGRSHLPSRPGLALRRVRDSRSVRWGVETEWPNVWLCSAGARRGGGVSGIPGHNAARAVLEAG